MRLQDEALDAKESSKLMMVHKERLLDVGPARLAAMDVAGIDMQVLSHVQPGVQGICDPALAISVSEEVNDWLENVVATYPTRFAGFACLPTQSPADAADELERTVREHGFKGALINGHTNGRYLDDPGFEPLLARAAALGVPIYLHPTDPPSDVVERYTEKERFAHGLAEDLLGLSPVPSKRSRAPRRWETLSAEFRSRLGRKVIAALTR